MLQEHDQVREDERDWVSNEAMSHKSLQYGGTFRNVLSRKIDAVIIPIFSQIIASIDQNYNLSLIDPGDENSPRSQFWLNMFSDCSIMQFNYTDLVIPKEHLLGMGGRKAKEDFRSEFPFSWLVFEMVESQWDNAKSYAGIIIFVCVIMNTKSKWYYFHPGNDRLQLYEQLCVAVQTTSIYDVLAKVKESDSKDFFRNYLHDFVRLVHRCDHRDKGHQNKEYWVSLIYGGILVSYCK